MRNFLKMGLFISLISLPLFGKILGLETPTTTVSFNKRMPSIIDQLSNAKDFRAIMDVSLGFVIKQAVEFEDHFFFRKEFFGFQTYLQETIFNKNVIPNKAIKGEKGWLFLGNSYNQALLESKNFINYSPHKLTKFQTVLTKRHNWCANRNIHYYFAIAPNKLSVYGDLLPIPNNNKPSKTSQLVAFNDLGLNVIDLKVNFDKYPDLRLFHKTDTHWNDLGGFIAYTNLVNVIKKDFPEVPLLDFSNFEMDTTISRRPRDLSRMLLLDIKEEQIILKSKIGYKGAKVKSRLKVPQNYHYNPTLYELRFRNKSAPLKVLVFRDSFGQALSKFLKESFGETLFIWKRTFDHALIEAYQPDIIIDEVVERNVDLFLDAQ